MKVHLRKPLGWYGPYHLVDTFLPFLSEDIRERIVEYIPNAPFQFVHNTINKIRKDKIKIEYHDIWSMDYTIARLAVPMLKMLKEKKHGIPNDFVHPLDPEMNSHIGYEQYSLFPAEEYRGESERQWNATLDKMIWSMEQIVNGLEKPDAYWEPYWEDMTDEEAAAEMLDKNNVWHALRHYHPKKKINKDLYKEFYEKMQEGLELFGKHFTSLWD